MNRSQNKYQYMLIQKAWVLQFIYILFQLLLCIETNFIELILQFNPTMKFIWFVCILLYLSFARPQTLNTEKLLVAQNTFNETQQKSFNDTTPNEEQEKNKTLNFTKQDKKNNEQLRPNAGPQKISNIKIQAQIDSKALIDIEYDVLFFYSIFCFIFIVSLIIYALQGCECPEEYENKNQLKRRKKKKAKVVWKEKDFEKQKCNHPDIYKCFQEGKQKYKQMLQTQCPICLEIKCDTRLLCGHIYHEKCISDWKDIKENCPICRQSGTFMVKFNQVLQVK